MSVSNTRLERFNEKISDCVLSMAVIDSGGIGDAKPFLTKVILDIAREARLHS